MMTRGQRNAEACLPHAVYAATDLSPWSRAAAHIPQLPVHLLLRPMSWSLGRGTPETGRLVPDTAAPRSAKPQCWCFGIILALLNAGGNGLSPGQWPGLMPSQVRRLVDRSMRGPGGHGGVGAGLERLQTDLNSKFPPFHLRTRTQGDPGGCTNASELPGVRGRVSFVYLFVCFQAVYQIRNNAHMEESVWKDSFHICFDSSGGTLARWTPNLKCVHRLWSSNPAAKRFS